MHHILAFFLICASCAAAALEPPKRPEGEKANPGEHFPRVLGAGAVFPVEDAKVDRARAHRVVIDATGSKKTDAGLNKELELAARAVNLYALAGVEAGRVDVAVVVHGDATPSILSDEAHGRLVGGPNPNTDLLAKLASAKVRVIVCGQAMRHRGYAQEDASPNVEITLSALTSLVELQDAGYRLVP